MLLRSHRYCRLLVAAVLACGCGPAVSYNEPTDPSKDADAIGAGTTPKGSHAATKKVKKPPGPVPKGAKNLQPLD